MDQNWEQADNGVWEDSNSSDDESSIGEFEGTDMSMINEPEEELCDFPREELVTVLDGLNKYPWTVYPTHLSNCIAAAAKIVSLGREELGGDIRRLQTLYREAIPNAFEKCLDDKAIWKWNNDIISNIFESICRLMDLITVKLPQLLLDTDDDMLPLLRTMALAFEKQCQFHVKHKDLGFPSPGMILSAPNKFARPIIDRGQDWYCLERKCLVRDIDGCDCVKCQAPESFCWLAYIIDYFGQNIYGNGYHHLVRVLNQPQKLFPAIMEALLFPMSKAADFITDDVAHAFHDPCIRILNFVAELLERDVDALSDKTRDGSFSALSLILKHLQVIIGRSTSAEKSGSMVSAVQRRMVERMLGFNSFNKQLSAVREINKLMENARTLSQRDKSRSVNTTIQWLEKNDILRHVLRSHLHHKQYVDQVEKIMRFLLLERRLSEEHLDAIWAATEKPDQFETVKANIFDLIADLAWSFSAEQLDSLFGRFERSQGRSASDIVKILSLVKKIARSDTKGVMASRLLELLWKMMHSGEAPTEVLDSGALTEILGHYDSVNCASKDTYISRCLKNVEEGISVISSLRLLREIILLDNEKPFYQGEVSRQTRVQKLIKENGVLHMVVSSLEDYMALLRSEKLVVVTSPEKPSFYSLSDGRYSHEHHVKERLEFLLFAIQSGDVHLPWDVAERLWNCMVEAPFCEADKERCLQWFCSALEKPPCLSLEALFNVLTQKLTSIDPKLLSETAWKCFMRLFLWVNLNEKKLSQGKNEEGTVTQDLDLIGLEYMWRVALFSPIESIAEQSTQMLRDIHTCLSYGLVERLVSIRQSFIDQCLNNLTTALEVERQKSSVEGAGSNTVASCSMVEGNTEKLGKISNGSYQVERCLCLLREFIVKCEGRCLRTLPPHGASFRGRPFKLGVSTANKQATRFELTVHTNESLGSLRSEVSKRMDCPVPVSRVRLMHSNKELTEDSQVLRQFGLTDGQPLVASVNIEDRVVEDMAEQLLPGVLISKRHEVYDILFSLADAADSRIREGANCLLSLLPTHPCVLTEFQTLHKKSPEKARELLSLQFASHSRLLYTLQVIDGLLMPVNRSSSAQTQRFRKDFVRFGGFKQLMLVLESGSLPGVDDQTRRGCYTSALRILKFLLTEKKSCESDESSPVIRAENIETAQSDSNGLICEKEDDELENDDLEAIVGALKRLTWAAALGRISILGMSTPLLEILKCDERFGRPQAKESADESLNQDDRYLCLEAFDLLVWCLQSHKSLLGSFFASAETRKFVVDMVLHSPDEMVRYQAASNFLSLSEVTDHGNQRVAHRHILAALSDSKAETATEPKRCLPFMELLGKLFQAIKGPEERAMGEQQLAEELVWIQSANETVDDDDRLLEGHLFLIKVLVEVLDRRTIGSSKFGSGLIQELIKKFLFPESAILCADEETFLEDDKILQSKCGTRRSREKAFQLLTCLATHCLENLREIVNTLVKIHFSSEFTEWEHLPSYGRKALGGYVGLKNAGATCYMNSVFQQLYMQPEVRRTVLECAECDDMDKAESVFFQLQAMFGALLGSSLDHYTPQGFWYAYRDYDGMPINLREHQDAFEFFNRLYDAVDETLKATHQQTTLTKIFGGVFVQQVISRGCSHRSERDEPFAAISVDVKNKRDLLESLESFVRGDLLEADNAYYCDECGRKVDALKRVCVKSLPETLVIHLKRFDFDYETMQRLKLKDRFEFPSHLNMKPYTVEGLAQRERQAENSPSSVSKLSTNGSTSDVCQANEIDSACSRSDSYYEYELVGVVVHSGTAFAGHYYSYIKQRPADRPWNSPSEWVAFDDKRVEPYDVNDLEKDCFGGKYTVEVYDNFLKKMLPQEFDRPNSAYMLLYEKCHTQVVTDSPVATSTSRTVGEDDDGDHLMKDTDRVPKRLQMPVSIHRCVWKENLRFVHENHLLDRDYFKFLFSLVEANTDVIDGRTLNFGADPYGNRGAGDFAKLNIKLSVEFLFRIYLRTHCSLREDLQHWKIMIWRLFEHSMWACQFFLEFLVDRPLWIHDFLLRCPVDDVRQTFAAFLAQALRFAVIFCQGNIYLEENGRQSDFFRVDAMIDILIALLRDVSPKCYLQQHFKVLLEYAKLGPYTRLHLLQKSLVGFLVNMATRFQFVKQDVCYIHSIVSLLVRNCDTSKLYDVDAKEGAEALGNPYQSSAPSLPLPKDAIECIFKHHVYTSVLIKTCPEQEDVVKLLEFCCWRNETLTLPVIQDILEALHAAVNSEVVKAILLLARHILQLNDSLQVTRQEILILGYEKFPPGIIDMVVMKAVTNPKRYSLMKFVAKVVEAFPNAKQYALRKKQDMRRATEWLQQEVQSAGSPGPANIPPISNEDLSNGFLVRTRSSEWTLNSLKTLLKSDAAAADDDACIYA